MAVNSRSLTVLRVTLSSVLLCLFANVTFTTTALAAPKVINKNPLTIKARLEKKILSQGEETKLHIELELADKHHAYLNMFKLEPDGPETLNVGDFDISPVVEFYDKFSKKNRKGVEEKSNLIASALAPKALGGGEQQLKMVLTYQACTDDYCLFPKKIPFSIPFTIETFAVETNTTDLAPTTTSSNADSFVSAYKSKGWLVVFAMVFFAGILTSFTPCIFPMIPITLAILGTKTANRKRISGFFLSLIYVFGIAMTYSLLGLFAASTGALFGGLLGHPVAVIAIASIFVLLALSMFGFFEIKLPDSLTTKLARRGSDNPSYIGSFVAGLFAGVVASPCVGPVLVSILTFVAKEQQLALGFFLLFTYAMGMGLIFIALGTFSQLANKLPRSGPWMNRIKIIFGIVMLAMAAYYVLPILPKDVNPLHQSQLETKVPWQNYSEELLAKAQAEGKPVIIDFYADWCAACKDLEYSTFNDSKILEIADQFVWVKFDATKPSPEFTLLKQKYEIIGLPNIVFYNSKGQWMKNLALTGFEDADQFRARLQKLK